MQINNIGLNNLYFKSTTKSSADDFIEDNVHIEVSSGNISENKKTYHHIYEDGLNGYHFGNIIEKSPKSVGSEDILRLPLKNIAKIEGTENSYRGQTLCFSKKESLERIKNAGIKTVVDLVGYYDYDTKIQNAGMKYFCYKVQDIYKSPAFDSLRDNQNRAEKFLNSVKNEGVDIDIAECLNRSREKFLKNTRDDINKFVDFINIMKEDNLYIGCEYGTGETDEALMLNFAFNPKYQDEPLTIDKLPLLNKMFNLYYNLTPEDKAKIGWTKETESKFMDRMADCHVELLSK